MASYLNNIDLNNGVSQDFKIMVENTIRKLLTSSNLETYAFPTSLSKPQRKYIHDSCQSRGLKKKSYGKEPDRYIQIYFYKKHQNNTEFCLLPNPQITAWMCEALNIQIQGINPNRPRVIKSFNYNGLLNIRSQRPIPEAQQNRLSKARQLLPIYAKKAQFLDLLNANQVIIISSETGSGKTTQIPQFILEQAYEKKEYCKIICTQPRRLSTVSVAERVAAERGEPLGDIVGYQIKLETKACLDTSLLYCTNGVLLRTFMRRTKHFFQNVTHFILDEVHERDKFTDLLLLSLRECLKSNPHVKLILMSATCEVELFMSYFINAQLLHVDGRCYGIDMYFLDDIQYLLGYSKEHPEENAQKVCALQYDRDEADLVINRCVESKEDEDCLHLLQLILSENVDINHQTPDDGFTPLMAASIAGNIELAEVLLKMGADISIKSNYCGYTAAKYAMENFNDGICDMILFHTGPESECDDETSTQQENPTKKGPINPDNDFMSINFNLIIELITYIRVNDQQGTILIFFPGYEDIVTCTNKISESSLNQNNLEIICLHSGIPSYSKRNVFDMYPNKQKIILSTNIAETGVTIPDVVYVIDTGLAKETSYDSLGDVCVLQRTFISQASADQRCGRAGRTRNGICFRLYWKSCYEAFVPDRIPEILRVPLYELCLQCKLLAQDGQSIEDYLNLAMQCPPKLSIECAIRGLIDMGALNEEEELTIFGNQLLQLSIEPHLGKSLIYSVMLKCLDPVLTIIAALSHEPFCLPSDPSHRRLATYKQRRLAEDSLSDHYGLIKAFDLFKSSKTRGRFECNEYFLSMGAMEFIRATREQLLNQLKSIDYISGHNLREYNVNCNKFAVVKACLAVGCYPNIAFRKGGLMTSRTESQVHFPAASTLSNNCANEYCVIYQELSKTCSKYVIRCDTVITPITLALLCGRIGEIQADDILVLNDWIQLEHNYKDLIKFREMISKLFEKRIAKPWQHYHTEELNVLNYLVNILVKEDANYGLANPLNNAIYINGNGNSMTLKPKSAKHQTPKFDFVIGNWQNPNAIGNTNNRRAVRSMKNQKVRELPNFDVRIDDENQLETPNNAIPINMELANLDLNCGESQISPKKPSSSIASQLLEKFSKTRNGFHYATNSQELLLEAIINNKGPENSNKCHLNASIYFIVKPKSENDFQLALSTRSWKFLPATSKKISLFVEKRCTVYLFFTIVNTRAFQGFAQLSGYRDLRTDFSIEWLSTRTITYETIEDMSLSDPSINDLKIFYLDNEQEIESNAAAIRVSELFLDPPDFS